MSTTRPMLRRRRRAQWWKPFASPRLLLVAAPIMLGPLAALFWFEEAAVPTPIELAITSLPTAGNASGTGTARSSDRALLGEGRLPNNVSLSMFANSARVEQSRIARADIAAATRGSDKDFAAAEFAALHPPTMGREDLLIGTLGMVYSTPMNMDLSLKLFEEFCNAMPGDAYYQVSMDSLPIDPNLRRALDRFSSTSTHGGPFCARLFRDDL